MRLGKPQDLFLPTKIVAVFTFLCTGRKNRGFLYIFAANKACKSTYLAILFSENAFVKSCIAPFLKQISRNLYKKIFYSSLKSLSSLWHAEQLSSCSQKAFCARSAVKTCRKLYPPRTASIENLVLLLNFY